MAELHQIYLTPLAEAWLRLYKPSTYGIDLSPEIAAELLEAGFVQWVPPAGFAGTTYGLTDRGAEYLDTVREVTP